MHQSHVDRVNFKSAASFGGKIDRLPVGRERGVERGRGEIGELFAPRTVRVHQADLVNLFDIARENNFARRGRVTETWKGEGNCSD